MSNTRKRKSSKQNNTNNMFKGSSPSGSKKKKSNGVDQGNADKMFDELADVDDPMIMGMEGISQLGEKLEMDVTEDIRILVLLWKLGAVAKPAEISKGEWTLGCNNLGIDSWDKLLSIVPSLDTGFLEETEFKDFYKFCFQFNRQGTHRTLDKDLVVALLKLVLKARVPDDRVDSFCQFLESSEDYSRVTLDQWSSFLDFSIECEDLSNYDESSSAWPVLIDEYVEYMEKQQKMQS